MDEPSPADAKPRALARELCALGHRLSREKRYDQASAAFAAALALEPGSADACNALGSAHHHAGRVEAALAAYHRTLALDPHHVKAQSNVGAAHMDRNEPDLAIAAYERALALHPAHAKIRTNLAIAQLLRGDWLAGWRNYESRWAGGAKGNPRAFTRASWQGERTLQGRSILLSSEQGFGDMMQFVRFLPQVAAQGARVHLEAKAPLVRLFRASFGDLAEVHCAGDSVPECDEYCTVLSLALAFATEVSSVPTNIPYLRSPERWTRPDLLPRAGLPALGIAWSGDPQHHNDRNRSLRFERFQTLLQGYPGIVVSLHKEVRSGDRAALTAATAVTEVADELTDFAATAALIAELDLVITVDTAVAHLAGALGKPTWILLPYAPDWRWMLGRTDSPWYPSLRLFRQPRPGDWDSVLAEVRAALAERFPPAKTG